MPNHVDLTWDTDVFATPTTATATQYILPDQNGYTHTVFTGTGFTYDGNGVPTGGTITSVQMVVIQTGFVFATLSNLNVTLADYGALLSSLETIRNQITWDAGQGDLIEFTATHIRLDNGDSTFTDINGTGFSQTGSQFTGTASSVQHIASNGTTVLASFNTTATLQTVAGALGDGATQVYNFLQTGGNTLTGGSSGGSVLVDGGATELSTGLWDGPGDDTIVGGNNNNFINYGDGSNAAVTVNLLTGHSSGGGGNDTLSGIFGVSGTDFNDTLIASNSATTLDGNAGDDTLIGGTGNDVLRGNVGNDSMDGGDGIDTVQFGGDNETGVTVNLSLTTAQNTGGSGTDTFLNIENADGTNFNDDFTGTAGANVLNGNGGNDTLEGGAGKDAVYGGQGDDLLIVDVMATGPGNAETVDGGDGNDTLLVDSATGTILAGHNVVSIENLEFSSTATFAAFLFNQIGPGLASTATITGGAAANGVVFIGGGPGAYSLVGTAFNLVNWTAGTDFITLTGAYANAPGNYSLTGSTYAENIVGGAGNDTLSGGDGNDFLRGGGGVDTVDGGNGVDAYGITAGAIDNNSGSETFQFHITDLTGSTFSNLEGLALGASGPSWVTINSSQLAGFSATSNIYGAASGSETDVLQVVVNTASVDLSGLVLNNWQSVTDWAAIQSLQDLFAGSLDAIAINASNAAETIIGSSGSDAVNGDADVGLGGNDTIHGGGGNDLLDGWGGVNQVFGDDGDDRLQVWEEDWGGSGTLDGGAGTDTLETHGTVNLTGGSFASIERFDLQASDVTPANPVTVTLLASTFTGGFSSTTEVVGSGVADTLIIAGITNLSLAGWTFSNWTAGVDALALIGDAGANTLTAASVGTFLNGGAGADTLIGGGGNDVFEARAGEFVAGESISGNAGSDTLRVSALSPSTSVDFSVGTLAGLERLTFGTNFSGVITAVMSGAQASSAFAANTIVTGSAAADAIVINNVTTLNMSGWTFSGWTINDSLKINGTSAANTITGSVVSDSISGGAGADTMAGGLGDDIYVVDNAGDVVTESSGQGTELVQALISYTLAPNVENLVITGAGGLSGTGNNLNNFIGGNGGGNTLDGKAGADTLVGGLGNDIYIVDNANDVVTENASEGIDTIRSTVGVGTLAANVENLELQATAITGNGNELNNRITGNASNNNINGGLGADTMLGGLGNDTYFVDNVGDAVNEASGEGTDTIFSTINIALLATNVENLSLNGVDAVTATGNSLNNVINGNSTNNVLNGGAGEDTLNGGLGNDNYVVNSAGDVVNDTGGNADTITSFIDMATLTANIENLTLAGTALIGGGNELNNIVVGNNLGNTLSGGLGNDQLNGATGADTMSGGQGDDSYLVENAGDVVIENSGEGSDTMYAFVSIAALAANVEKLNLMPAGGAIDGTANELDNRLNGNDFANTLTALGGNDVIQGLGGNDHIIGGAGLDNIFGGTGNDVFVYQLASDSGTTGGTRDLINDFTQGQDTIDLSAIDAITGGGDDAFSFLGAGAFTNVAGQLRYDFVDAVGTANDFTIVSMDVDGNGVADSQIGLRGLITLTGADFVL